MPTFAMKPQPGTARHPATTVAVFVAALAVTLVLAGCGDLAKLPPMADVGPEPTLPPPVRQMIPTVNIAPAQGWPAGQMPLPMAGLRVTAFATGLDHPRWLQVLPNGDVLVAEANKPAKSAEGLPELSLLGRLKAWATQKVMARAGAGVPSANRISLLRDADGDGVAELKTVFAEGLNSPFGMALVGRNFYVANTDAILRFDWQPGQTRLQGPGAKVTDLPAGPINHHWTKALMASPDGRYLYATVGSNSNVAENGLDAEAGRAAIWQVDLATGHKRLFATGLRNPNGMGWAPGSGNSNSNSAPVLWTVVNERDELGSDLVPDYLTSVKDGAFYGWPYSYYGRNVDARVQPAAPERVARAVVPDYALGAHVAPLGLAFSGALTGGSASGGAAPASLTAQLAQGAFIGLHGSWNRKPLSGYKVVFVPFENGRPKGVPVDVLTGFLSPDGKAWGRPVGVALDAQGALLVADDVGNTVWRVNAGR